LIQSSTDSAFSIDLPAKVKEYPNWIRIDLDENWMARAPKKKRRKRRHSDSGASYRYKSEGGTVAPSRGSSDEEGIIIRPPKGYFSIKTYPEMKPKK